MGDKRGLFEVRCQGLEVLGYSGTVSKNPDLVTILLDLSMLTVAERTAERVLAQGRERCKHHIQKAQQSFSKRAKAGCDLKTSQYKKSGQPFDEPQKLHM